VVLIYLKFYKTHRGDIPVIDYILQIDDLQEAADIRETLANIDEEGARYLIDGGEITRSLGDGLWEIKKEKHRFYYVYCSGNIVYILHACYKQKQKAEKCDIELGRKRMIEIKFSERMR
jgi:phage-related protein